MVRIKRMRNSDYNQFLNRHEDKIYDLDFPELRDLKSEVGVTLSVPEKCFHCSLPHDEYESSIAVYRCYYNAADKNEEYRNLGYSNVYIMFAFYLDRNLKPGIYIPKKSNHYNDLTGNILGEYMADDLDFYHSRNFQSIPDDRLLALVNMDSTERISTTSNLRLMRSIDFGMFSDSRAVKRILRDQLRPSKNIFVKKTKKRIGLSKFKNSWIVETAKYQPMSNNDAVLHYGVAGESWRNTASTNPYREIDYAYVDNLGRTRALQSQPELQPSTSDIAEATEQIRRSTEIRVITEDEYWHRTTN